MAKDQKTPLDNTSLAAMANRLKSESDRAVALSVAAWVDDALKEWLRAHLNKDAALDDLFRHMGPISTFSSRILLAHALGLINKSIAKNLDTIRDIRNDFAHFRDDIDFTNQSVVGRCKNLMLARLPGKRAASKPQEPFIARKAFVATGLILAAYFIEHAAKPGSFASFDDTPFREFVGRLAGGLRSLIEAKAKAEKKADAE